MLKSLYRRRIVMFKFHPNFAAFYGFDLQEISAFMAPIAIQEEAMAQPVPWDISQLPLLLPLCRQCEIDSHVR